MNLLSNRLSRNAPCWCRSGKKYKACHYDFDEKIRNFARQGHEVPPHSLIKSDRDVDGIRRSAAVNMAALDAVASRIGEGMSTAEIDRIVHETTVSLGGIPAPLGYEGFPRSVCTSVNDEVCHGIPSEQVRLRDGDIVNVDCSTIYEGYYSDSSRMFLIGNVSEERRRLVEVTKECVEIGISRVSPWHFMGDMGDAVHRHAEENGYHVVREIGGHGCGLEFHEDPFVSYVSEPGTGMLMVPGMVFTIEPMVNMGTDEIWIDDDNGWTVHTDDGLPSAQWEVQILVTQTGHELLSW